MGPRARFMAWDLSARQFISSAPPALSGLASLAFLKPSSGRLSWSTRPSNFWRGRVLDKISTTISSWFFNCGVRRYWQRDSGAGGKTVTGYIVFAVLVVLFGLIMYRLLQRAVQSRWIQARGEASNFHRIIQEDSRIFRTGCGLTLPKDQKYRIEPEGKVVYLRCSTCEHLRTIGR